MGGLATRIRSEILEDGTEAEEFALDNRRGMTALLGTQGARLNALYVPDRHGRTVGVVLGFERLADWPRESGYLGATVGRYANRIAGGSFALDGQHFQVPVNDPPADPRNVLHGGLCGLDKALWQATPGIADDDTPAVSFTLVSPDGDQGFPGRLALRVRYVLTADGTLTIDYSASTSRPTVLNLTNHAYFNLAGEGAGSILDHLLEIAADCFTPVGPGLIPTGELRPVEGTAFDFRHPARIGTRIDDQSDEQLRIAGGYDHNFVLRTAAHVRQLRFAARLHAPRNGLAMEMWTTEPGLLFYSGNFLAGLPRGRGGIPLAFRSGLCLETQQFPDAPNQPHFPSTVLRPGETFRSRTEYRFRVES
jgi:aldose 1-epimerase